jgi:branched-chain amino acid transport system substrate-binding protein
MSRRTRIVRWFVVCTIILGAVALLVGLIKALPAVARTSAQSPAAAQPVITIGVAAPTTFFLSQTLAWPVVNAVQLAVSQTNAAGGINVGGVTYTLALAVADDGCNATQAITAANTLISARVSAVVGHVCSAASIAAQSVYAAAGVPMVSPASSSTNLTRQGYTTTFRTISADGSAAAYVATYLHSVRNLTRSVIVDCYCHMSAPQYGDVYSATFTSQGGTITSRRTIHSGDNWNAVLTNVKTENPDAILFVDSDAATAGQFSGIAYAVGMTNVVVAWVPNYSGDAALATYAGNAGGAVFDDVIGAMPYRTDDMPRWPVFLAAYRAAYFVYAQDDPGVASAFAYDAAKIIMGAIRRANSDVPTQVRNQIAATHGYHGVVGTYVGFDARGDVIPQWAWLWHFETTQWVVYAVRTASVYTPLVLR